MKYFTAVLCVVACVAYAEAQEAHIFALDSTISCGKWLDASKQKGRAADNSENWILAYASGFAIGRRNNYWRDVDSASILHWVDKYCRENPLSSPTHGIGCYWQSR